LKRGDYARRVYAEDFGGASEVPKTFQSYAAVNRRLTAPKPPNILASATPGKLESVKGIAKEG
jgi:hypothetical protein